MNTIKKLWNFSCNILAVVFWVLSVYSLHQTPELKWPLSFLMVAVGLMILSRGRFAVGVSLKLEAPE